MFDRRTGGPKAGIVPVTRRGWTLGSTGVAIAGLGLCVLVALATHSIVYRSHVEDQRRADAQRLEFFGTSLEYALDKNEHLPFLLGLEGNLTALLLAPEQQRLIDDVNRYLELVQGGADLAAAFLIDVNGRTLAASNWDTPHSFVGVNYGFRPYFQEAMAGRTGRFFGIGVTSGEAGYYLSSPIRHEGRVLGVIVVKIGIDDLERAWQRSGEQVLVADADGVVFLSSEPGWRYKLLSPLSKEARARVTATRQYRSLDMPPLIDGVVVRTDGRAQTVRLGQELLSQSRTLRPLGWTMLLFSELREARGAALAAASGAGFAIAFLLTAVVYVNLRRRRTTELRDAREALQEAYDELEKRIAERTALLTAANERLEERVTALKRTERILREAQDTSVQAGKLAVLGQMAAGVTHELNQPLTALTTLQDNAVKLVQLGRLDEASENLRLMSQLTQKMGRIVGQLKAFARKGPAQLTPISVAESIANALLLVESRRREAEVSIDVDQPDIWLRVLADGVRLEQVLVNLLRNGIEAMDGCSDKRLFVTVSCVESEVRIAVHDHGCGISEAVGERLFEPFFTSKPPGMGLGLGLNISKAIMQSVGGDLAGANAPDGGAEFVLTLVRG